MSAGERDEAPPAGPAGPPPPSGRTAESRREHADDHPAEGSSALTALRERTERLLDESVRRYERVDDRYEVPYRSTRIVVHPIDWTRGRTVLRIVAPVVVDVLPHRDLHARLSELNESTVFGKFFFRDGTVFLEHNLLGESLDREQFKAALASVAHHADHLDEVLIAEFGGRRWSER